MPSLCSHLITLGDIVKKYGHYDEDLEARAHLNPDDPFGSSLAMLRRRKDDIIK